MLRFISAAVPCFVVLWGAVPPAADPVRAKLDAALAAYDLALEQYRAGACDWFDRGEQAARERGDKGRVDRIKVERQAFEEKDVLPATAPAALRRAPGAARSALEAAYRRAVAEYTRAKNDDAAAAAEQALARFQQHETGGGVDRLQAGTRWVGVNTQASGANQLVRNRVTLSVFERNGETFKARFLSATIERVITGHVKGRTVWWSKDDVRVVRGSGPGTDCFGYINDKTIKVRFEGFTPRGQRTLGFVEYRLDESR